MPSVSDDAVRLLRASELFGGLLDEDYELLRSGTRIRKFATGAPLFYEHDEGGSAFLIVEGCISIERTADSSKGDAETVQLAVRGPGEFIGELSLFDDTPRNADARALEPTTVLQLRGKHVLSCAQQSPELALSLMRRLAGKIREATDRRTHARVANVRGRLLKVLEEEGRLHGIDELAGVRILMVTKDRRLTQADLGIRAGCDRAVVNRTLADLVQEGIVEKDRHFILLRHLPRGQVVAGTLLRAARENRRGDGAALMVNENQLQTLPKLLASTADLVGREIDRLAVSNFVLRTESGVLIDDEAALARLATGSVLL